MQTDTDRPVVIEAAVSPYRPGEPVQNTGGTIREAIEWLDAGAGIVHHHHDMRHDQAAGIDPITTLAGETIASPGNA